MILMIFILFGMFLFLFLCRFFANEFREIWRNDRDSAKENKHDGE